MVERKYAGEFFKWTSPGRRGVHDRILILPNVPVVFVELKRSDAYGRSPYQKYCHDRMVWLGQESWLIYDLLPFEIRIDEYLERCDEKLRGFPLRSEGGH